MRKIKRILAVAAAVLLLCVSSASAGDYWYSDYITRAAELEIIAVENPDENITNAEFTSAALKLAGIDIDASEAVEYARIEGYVLDDEMSDINTAVTRQSVAKVISRLLSLPDTDTIGEMLQISDWDDTCSKCKEHIVKCYVNGIMGGYPDGTFRGRYAATKAEVAAVLCNAYDYEVAYE